MTTSRTKLLPELLLGSIFLFIGLYKMQDHILMNSLISSLGGILILAYIVRNFLIKR